MRRILTPVDGSISSQFAAAHVAERMRAGEALALHVLNVQHRPHVLASLDYVVSAGMIDEFAQAQGCAALAPVMAVLDEAGVACSSEIAFGDPGRVIFDHAATGAYDEIVMGTRGASVVASVLVGSVATKVISTVALPITLVPTPTLTMHRTGRATPENAALAPEARTRKLILVPVDGSDYANRAIDHLIAEAGRGVSAELVVLNVQPPYPETITRIAGLASAVNAAQQEEGVQQSQSATARLASAGLSFRTIVDIGDPAERIARNAKELAATRIVMGTRGAGGLAQLLFGSTAKRVLHLVNVPVTLVK